MEFVGAADLDVVRRHRPRDLFAPREVVTLAMLDRRSFEFGAVGNVGFGKDLAVDLEGKTEGFGNVVAGDRQIARRHHVDEIIPREGIAVLLPH